MKLFRVALAVTLPFGAVAQLFNSPSKYFGGSNNAGYVDWVARSAAANYNASLFISADADATKGVAVHWKIANGKIVMGIVARASGWVAFGLSEVGGMLGADMVVFEAAKPDVITDSYVTDTRYPLPDTCQDWQLISSNATGGFLIVEAHRLLDTKDPQDRPIANDLSSFLPVNRVIAAWGNSPSISYHGLDRARGGVRWFSFGIDDSAAFANKMKQVSEGSFELRSHDYPVKNVETEYLESCMDVPTLQGLGVPDSRNLNIVGLEPILDPRGVPYVHHFTVYGSPNVNVSCNGGITDLIYAWAPGDRPFALPDNVGNPLGSNGYQTLRLEIHYNNPQLVQGVLDSSGVRIYYSTKKMKYDLGIFQVGDPFLSLNRDAVGDGLTQHVFECPASCTMWHVREPITVVYESLHMHKSGVTIKNELIRAGSVVHSSQVEYWEYAQQGLPAQRIAPFRILPGDSFRTTCNFNNAPGSNRKFGFGSQEEMCISFLYYYPKQTAFFDRYIPWLCGPDLFPLWFCTANYTKTALSSFDDLQRSFGVSAQQCQDPNAVPPVPSPPSSRLSCPSSAWCDSQTGTMFWMYNKRRTGSCDMTCVSWASVATYKLMGYNCGRCP